MSLLRKRVLLLFLIWRHQSKLNICRRHSVLLGNASGSILRFIAGEAPSVSWYRDFVSVLHHCHIMHCHLSQTPKSTEYLSLSLIYQNVLMIREKGASQFQVSAPSSFAVPLSRWHADSGL